MLRSALNRILPGLALIGLLLTAGCGDKEDARQSELNQLREQVSKGSQVQERLLETLGETVSLRTRLRTLATDTLRQNTADLAQRMNDTGNRIGLRSVGRLVVQDTQQVEGPLRLQVFRITARGDNDLVWRWMQEMVTWDVGIVPLNLAAVRDPRSGYEHNFTFGVPLWDMPPEAPRPEELPPPGPEPEGDVEHEMWRLRQNLALIQADQAALPGIRDERQSLQTIFDALESYRNQSRRFVQGLGDVLNATRRAGVLRGFLLEPGKAEVTVVAPSAGAVQSFLGYLNESPVIENARQVEQEATRAGLRTVVNATLVVKPGSPAT